jgi:predicted NACHT family NTPase
MGIEVNLGGFKVTITGGYVIFDRLLGFIGLRFRQFERKYLKWVAEEHRYLKLVGIRREIVSDRPELEEIYVSLKVAPRLTKEGRFITGYPISLSEALKKNQCLVILGIPGSGKTTMLNYLALNFANKRDGSYWCDTE